MIADKMPPFAGTFSYKNDNIYRRSCGEGVVLVMERVDPDLAKIRFEREPDNQSIDIPVGFSVIHAGAVSPAFRVGNEYFIVTWTANYVVLRGEEALFNIYNQKSQAIMPAPNQ
jgi:hypothetical protein